MNHLITVIVDHKVEIISGLFLLSEALSFIPQVKANGVFQGVFNGLKWLKEKFAPAQA